MSTTLRHIRESLSLRLSLSIMGGTAIIFFVTMGFLYYRSSTSIHKAAVEEASQALNNTSRRLGGLLNEVEAATNNTDWVVVRHLQPDSLFTYSRRILELNPNLFGCSIAMTPNFFPEWGEYFSAYSSNEDGHIETEQEGNDDYRYFDLSWYREAMKSRKACWIDPFYDYDSEEGTYETEMIASYCKPLVTPDGRQVGVISADLSQKRLSEILAQENPYPHSFYLLLGAGGRLIASGQENATREDLERSDCLVLRQGVERTGWTICIVCPKRDIYKGYNRLIYIILSILFFGLLLIVAFCYVMVHHAVTPLHLLADQTQKMAHGSFEEPLPLSTRVDETGQLQNTFVTMQQSITGYVTDLRKVKEETQRRNEELIVAKSKAEEADRKKTEFIQDLTHQIRTPLNIIGGFAQVLHNDSETLLDEDIESISKGILQNSQDIQAIIHNLLTIAALEDGQTIACHDEVRCNDLCQEVLENMIIRHPNTVSTSMETAVPDTFTIKTHREHLLMILRELLENANKFTKVGSITLRCQQVDNRWMEFIVSDTGQGISPADGERIFTMFTKLSSFSEGLGLGLYLCRRVTGLMGGEISLDDTYTGGSRFIVRLPIDTYSLPTYAKPVPNSTKN